MLTIIDKIRLNIYPLLLLIISVSIAILSHFIIIGIVLKVILYFLAFIIITYSYQLFSTYPSKLRSIILLIKKNRNSIDIYSFEKYMSAPCGREVVKIVLSKLSKKEIYTELKTKFPLQSFSIAPTRTKIIYYKNNG